jgi:hypothetical protein
MNKICSWRFPNCCLESRERREWRWGFRWALFITGSNVSACFTGEPPIVFHHQRACGHVVASVDASWAGAGCPEATSSPLSRWGSHHLFFLSFQHRHQALASPANIFAITSPLPNSSYPQLHSLLATSEPVSAISTHLSCLHDTVFLTTEQCTTVTASTVARPLQWAFHRAILHPSFAMALCCSSAHLFHLLYIGRTRTLPSSLVCAPEVAVANCSAASCIFASTVRPRESWWAPWSHRSPQLGWLGPILARASPHQWALPLRAAMAMG